MRELAGIRRREDLSRLSVLRKMRTVVVNPSSGGGWEKLREEFLSSR